MESLIPKRANMLVLKGVFPHEISMDRVITVEKKVNIDAVYTDIPKRFVDVESWPKFSNLKCWECDQFPDSYPKFIPRNPHYSPSGDTCEPFGHFCEWNCAASFVYKETPRDRQWDELYNLCIFESKFTGKRREKIPRAPAKWLMSAYSGNSGITPRQWREKLAEANRVYSTHL